MFDVSSLAIVLGSITSVLLCASIVGKLVNLSLFVGKRLLGCGECILCALKVCLGLSLSGCEVGNLFVLCLGESFQLVVLLGKSLGVLCVKVA